MWFLFHFNHIAVSIIQFLLIVCSTGTDDSETCDMSCQATNQALVLYDESKLSPLVKPSRSFNFVNTDIVIKQDWGKLGVAAVVWDAAIVLCEYLEEKKDDIAGKQVIELGAGSGLVGIVASLLGAEVVITDRETVFPYLRQVVKENLKGREGIQYSVKVLDWTKDKFPHKYDIILGADIIYVEEIFDALLETLTQLSHKKTKIFLSCKIRYDRDTNFLDRLKHEFSLEEIRYDKDKDIKIFLCMKL